VGEVIRARLAAHPFVPFRLVLVAGHAFDVTASDLAAIEMDGEVVRLFTRPPGRPNGRTLKAVAAVRHVVLLEDANL
jgi:hypothetical protein